MGDCSLYSRLGVAMSLAAAHHQHVIKLYSSDQDQITRPDSHIPEALVLKSMSSESDLMSMLSDIRPDVYVLYHQT